jgi:hypothetical protein
MTSTDGASANNITDRRQAPRPPVPAGAQTEHKHFDEQQGMMYAPTSLSVEGCYYLADACPMRYNVVTEDTYLEFGAPHLELSLMCSDQALVNLARLANKAVREMVHKRGMPLPDPINSREPD